MPESGGGEQQNKKGCEKTRNLLISWSGWQDSNLRFQRPERCALARLSHIPSNQGDFLSHLGIEGKVFLGCVCTRFFSGWGRDIKLMRYFWEKQIKRIG